MFAQSEWGEQEENTLQAKLAQIDSASDENFAILEELLQQATKNASVQIRLKQAALYRRSGQLDKAETIVNDFEKSLESYDRLTKIAILRSAAALQRSRNNYQGAEQLIKQKVMPLVISDDAIYGEVHHELGRYLRLQFRLSEAKKHFEVAEAFFEKTQNILELASVYSSLGVLHESLTDYSVALSYEQKVLEIYKVHGASKSDRAGNYFNLGEVYYRTGEYELALGYFNKALILDTELNSINDMAFDYHRIASQYYEMAEYNDALKFTKLAITLLIQQQANQALSRSYAQEAQIYAALNQQTQRENSLLLAQQANDKSPTDLQQSRLWYDYAELYSDKGDLQQALEFAKKATELGQKLETARYGVRDNKLLAELYFKTNAFESAYLHLNKAYELNQTITDESRIKESEKYKRDVQLLEERLKVEELEKQTAQQNDQAAQVLVERQRWLSFGIFILFVLISLKYYLWQKHKTAAYEARLYAGVIRQKNQLLADVSHELRTPLSTLKLHIEALQHNLIEDVSASYDMLNKKVTEINRLITDIYQLAQSDIGTLTLNMVPCDIGKLLDQCAHDFKKSLSEESLSFSYDIQIENVTLHCDKEKIKQVLSNLFANSRFYTSQPGVIRLHAYTRKNLLFIVLEDSSPGVDADQVEKIFSRLHRVEASRSRQTGGSGLGLAICRSLVNNHQGHIVAEQSELGGLKVTISLPV
ncbi:tetratricopeptide repeat protein [Thalassotalea euphylliae]|uniref:tetratricopeptide repeat protein n=1 Tax=Thalassotalea euphylliae TaxID=1655234 RepID=UPI00362A6823